MASFVETLDKEPDRVWCIVHPFEQDCHVTFYTEEYDEVHQVFETLPGMVQVLDPYPDIRRVMLIGVPRETNQGETMTEEEKDTGPNDLKMTLGILWMLVAVCTVVTTALVAYWNNVDNRDAQVRQTAIRECYKASETEAERAACLKEAGRRP